MGFKIRYNTGISAEAPAQEIMGAITRIEDFDRVHVNNRVLIAARQTANQRASLQLSFEQSRINKRLAEQKFEIDKIREARLARQGQFDMNLALQKEGRLTAAEIADIGLRSADLDIRDRQLQRLSALDAARLTTDTEEDRARRDKINRELSRQGARSIFGGEPIGPGETVVLDGDGTPVIVSTFIAAEAEQRRRTEEALAEARISTGGLTPQRKREIADRDRMRKESIQLVGEVSDQASRESARLNRIDAAISRADEGGFKDRAIKLRTDRADSVVRLDTLVKQINILGRRAGIPVIPGDISDPDAIDAPETTDEFLNFLY